jgi:release factor glutamine methyltransferase
MKPNGSPPLQTPIDHLGNWLKDASRRLESICDSPALEAQMTAAFVLGKPRSWILAHPETVITDGQLAQLDDILNKLADGYPFAYISGEREFYGRIFKVHPGLLVPRPETELLVETALDWLRAYPQKRSAVDVGCGTGCIAVTLAAEIPDLRIDAVDIDPLAVETTRHNTERLGTNGRVHAFSSDLLEGCTGSYDLICANLPYIPASTVDSLPAARHEPRLALDGGPDGLTLICRLLSQAVSRLHPGGRVLLEIEASQGQSAPELARQFYPAASISLKHDLAGQPRLVSIQL